MKHSLLLFFSVILLAQQNAYSSEMLTLIRKIQVDHQRAAGAVDGCAFSTKGDFVAASDNTGLTKIYRVADGEFVMQVKHNDKKVSKANGETNAIHFSVDDRYVEAVEWSTDGQYLFTGGLYDDIVRVWRVADWSVVGLAQGQKYNRQVEYMAINPENILATGGDEGFLYLLKFNPPVINEPIQR